MRKTNKLRSGLLCYTAERVVDRVCEVTAAGSKNGIYEFIKIIYVPVLA
jgi:hypothetical protein